VVRFDSAESMVATLAGEIAADLTDGVRRKDAASFVASGGTTPGILFDALAAREAPWDKIFVTTTDERWVSPDDDRSNEKLIRTRLLRGHASGASFVPLKTQHGTTVEAEAEVDRAIGNMPRPFDVTLLGMGNDGHMASLFPGAKELPLALDLSSPALACAIAPPDIVQAGPRMSLTLRAILASRWIVILIRGQEKMRTYRAAQSGTDVLEMPVRAVLHQSTVPVEIYWSP